MTHDAQRPRRDVGTLRPTIWLSVILTALLALGQVSFASVAGAGGIDFTAAITNIPASASTGDSFDADIEYTFAYEDAGYSWVTSLTTDVCEVSMDIHVEFVGYGTCTIHVSSNWGSAADQSFEVTLPSDWIVADARLIAPNSDHQSTDFSGADLSWITFPNGVNLSNSTFSNADLSGTDLSQVTLTGSTGTNITVNASTKLPPDWIVANGILIGPYTAHQSTDFSGADLSGLTFPSYVDLSNSSFSNADLSGTDLSNTTLTGSTGTGITTDTSTKLPLGWMVANGILIGTFSDHQSTDFTGADLSGLTFPSYADLSNSIFTNTDLSGTDLSQVALTGSVGTGITVDTDTKLPLGWMVANGILIGPFTDHQSTDFTGADLSDLALPGFVDLSNSTFTNANLSGTDLSNTTLTGSTGTGVIIDADTQLPLGWIVADGYLIGPGSSYTDVDFSGADLSGLTFPQSTISVTSLAKANLDGTDLSAVDLSTPDSNYSVDGTPSALPNNFFFVDGVVYNFNVSCDTNNPSLPCYIPPCDPTDPASPCYVPPCDPADPSSPCYVPPCDPTDPTGGCYVPQTPSAPEISNIPSSPTVGGSFTPVISSSGDGTTSVSSSTPAVCAVDGSGLVSLLTVGTCRLVAHITAGALYGAAEGNEQSFEVVAAPPAEFRITTVSISPAPVRAGMRYDSAPLTTSGAVGAVKWRISAGALPTGLRINAKTGVIFGRISTRWYPTGTRATFTVTATTGPKGARVVASVELTLDVAPRAPRS